MDSVCFNCEDPSKRTPHSSTKKNLTLHWCQSCEESRKNQRSAFWFYTKQQAKFAQMKNPNVSHPCKNCGTNFALDQGALYVHAKRCQVWSYGH